jgi:hypothetical protein
LVGPCSRWIAHFLQIRGNWRRELELVKSSSSDSIWGKMKSSWSGRESGRERERMEGERVRVEEIVKGEGKGRKGRE